MPTPLIPRRRASAPRSAAMYLDECGNTGLNLNDASQRYFTVAGWIVTGGQGTLAARLVRSHLQQSQVELKGSAMLRNKSGRDRAARLLNGMMEVGCLPTFGVAEKRFVICGKIVENFLDPPVNPEVSFFLTDDPMFKIQMANALYHLPHELLVACWESFRLADARRIETALDDLVREFQSLGLASTARAFSGALANTREIARLLRYEGPGPVGSEIEGPHMPMIISLVSQLELLFRRTRVTNVTITHDATREFASAIQWGFESVRDATEHRQAFSNGNTLVLGLRSIKRLKFVDSKSEPLVQASDVLASAFTKVVATLDFPHSEDLYESVSRVIQAGIAIEGLWNVLGSRDLGRRVLAVGGLAEH